MVGRRITVDNNTAAPTLLINNFSSVVYLLPQWCLLKNRLRQWCHYIPYSANFLCVFNFTNFANFQLFAKMFPQKFLMYDTVFMLWLQQGTLNIIPGLSCRICKKLSPRRHLQSRHCFADSCKLKGWQCNGMVHVRKTGQIYMPHP